MFWGLNSDNRLENYSNFVQGQDIKSAILFLLNMKAVSPCNKVCIKQKLFIIGLTVTLYKKRTFRLEPSESILSINWNQ